MLVADPGLRLFRQFGAVKDASNEPLHATIVLNPAGKATLKEIGDTPFQDFAAVQRALAPRKVGNRDETRDEKGIIIRRTNRRL